MKKYIFEFYNEYYGEETHCFVLNSELSEEQIIDIFKHVLSINKPIFDNILKRYLKNNNIPYSGFMYVKKDTSYEDVRKRWIEIKEDFEGISDYDFHYVLYQNLGRFIDGISNKFSFIAKKVNGNYKIISQTNLYDDFGNEGAFFIKNNIRYLSVFLHGTNDNNHRNPIIHCDSKWLMNMLIHIDEINDYKDVDKFCRNKLLQNIDKISSEEDFEEF